MAKKFSKFVRLRGPNLAGKWNWTQRSEKGSSNMGHTLLQCPSMGGKRHPVPKEFKVPYIGLGASQDVKGK